MNKRFWGAGIALALCLGLHTPVLAADPAAMTDISEHWAQSTIQWSMEEGLFNGTTDTTFEPDSPITRGMFVTVLSRLEGINEADYPADYLSTLYTDVDSSQYYAPAIKWATLYGIVNGMGDGSFHPNEPVTREQMAAMVIRYGSNCNYNLGTVQEPDPGEFTDLYDISDFAAGHVASLKATGILKGNPNGDGTYFFAPRANATRAEGATVFQRLNSARIPITDNEWVAPESISLTPAETTLERGESTQLISAVFPEDCGNRTVTWVSMNPDIVSVDHNGNVTGISPGTAEIYAYTYNGHYSNPCTVTCTAPPELAYDGETYAQKCVRIFGEVVPDHRTVYDAKQEGLLTQITIPTWDYNSSRTAKVTKYRKIWVHQNIAATLQAAFDEIYNSPEQQVISDIGGYYASSGLSEHPVGLAFDVNVDSNYYCQPDGTAITGSHWDPDNDPYSIPLDCDFVRILKKYGFTRGIYWRSGKKDYMHFSYFGT